MSLRTEPLREVVVPGLIADMMADVLAPIWDDAPPSARVAEQCVHIGYALRAAAHGVEVDWPRVLDIVEHVRPAG